MQAIDFGRSFVTFVTHGRENNARIQVEAKCEFTDMQAGTTKALYLVASCKSEATFAEKDLFTQPNYDFCGIFNEKQYSIIRTHANAADDEPDVGLVEERFLRVYDQIVMCPARVLEDGAAVVEATLGGAPIVCRTEIEDEAGRFRCLLEYPVKTMNANDIRNVFQVDTGPVPFPDWDSGAELTASRFRLAYVAFNRPSIAYFVVLAPTEIAPRVLTPHYSEVVCLAGRNEALALE